MVGFPCTSVGDTAAVRAACVSWMSDQTAIEAVVTAELGGVKELDEDIFAYILGIVQDTDSHGCDPETLTETVRHVSPSVRSSQFADGD